MSKFCVEGENTNPRCYKIESVDFDSEEQIFDILLDLLKSELPPRLALVQDCSGNPMVILEDGIDYIPPTRPMKYSLILNPLSARPSYDANFYSRTLECGFEVILSVSSTLLQCVTWELLRFKNAVEALLVGSEFYIDGYDSVDVEPTGFEYSVPEQDSGGYYRQGVYRFSVTVTQYRNNN